ncbi:S9 family peptidase [Dyella subtropica]|uniref:S9 family peptidase n=1 Tax=Dyella subtropica TaxID=2992127 RepID=UPI002250091B|nr:prolyl oligopeptidase family serine peptidase [Dyella subtropica]
MNITWLLASLLLFSPTVLASSSVGPPPVIQRVEVGNRITEGVPDLPKALIERMQRYQNTRAASFGGWLANGQGMLIRTRFADTPQVHWVQSPGGARQQLTFYGEPIQDSEANPVRNGFLFGMDTGGSEFWQIYYFDLDSRSVRMLTDGKSRNENAVWSHHGDRVAFSTTQRNGSDVDVHVVGLDGGASRAVLERRGNWYPFDWSPDDRQLLVSQYVSAEESRPWLVDVERGTAMPIYDEKRKVNYDQMKFSRDGKGIYYTSNETGEFIALRYRDLASGKTRNLTENIPWDVEDFVQSKNGKQLAFVVNQDGISVPHLLDLASGHEASLPKLPGGVVGALAFSPDNQRLAFVLSAATSPGDVYALNLHDNMLERWTASEVGGLDASRFVEPELIHYPTFDQLAGGPRHISAFYYRPRGQGPFPVVIQIHGGPEDQARPRFDPQVQFWVNEMNMAVLIPNVRGSTGYGKTYLSLDNGLGREGPVRDIGALLDWIGRRPELDAKRVGVYGGSYGGFMVLASMTHFNDRLRAGIELSGQSNFVSFLEHTESYRRDFRRAEYGDERNPEMRAFLERIAPANNARKITRPLFIAAGSNDPRVPASEGKQMADAVRGNGGTVWYLEFKDEGHGYQKKPNRDYFNAASAWFWQMQLLQGEAPR